jgi:cellulose synthase operon protein YhjU
MHMIAAIVGLLLTVFLVKDWIRITTVIYLLFILAVGLNYDLLPTKEVKIAVTNTNSYTDNQDIPPQNQIPNNENLNSYLDVFSTKEKPRIITMPTQLGSSFEPFDIVLINICSMADDDLKYSGLQSHPVFDKFDISFQDFNSAASYSTPASLRLLRSNCGQETESEMYRTRKPECELITTLESIGFSSSLYLDHTGKYGNYLESLRKLGGLTAPLNDLNALGIQYNSFDGSPVYSDKDLFDNYLRHMKSDAVHNNIAFFNLIALHDGNTLPNDRKPLSYSLRANILLDNINELITDLDKSGRKTMLVVIPEHGAALRGDKMQISKLREIPNTKITHVPTYIKFIGLGSNDSHSSQIKLQGSYSYLALSEIIRRVITGNIYSTNDRKQLNQIVADLPQTADISESTNSFFMRFAQKPFFKLKGDSWKPYVE